MEHQRSDLEVLAAAVYAKPAFLGLLITLGSIGRILLSDEPIVLRKVFGGIAISLFLFLPVYSLGVGFGWDDHLAAGVALIFASAGEAGYQILMDMGRSKLK